MPKPGVRVKVLVRGARGSVQFLCSVLTEPLGHHQKETSPLCALTALHLDRCLNRAVTGGSRVRWVDELESGKEPPGLPSRACTHQPLFTPCLLSSCPKGNRKWLFSIQRNILFLQDTRSWDFSCMTHVLLDCPRFPRMPRHFWNL